MFRRVRCVALLIVFVTVRVILTVTVIVRVILLVIRILTVKVTVAVNECALFCFFGL